jgi:hypothetical protein
LNAPGVAVASVGSALSSLSLVLCLINSQHVDRDLHTDLCKVMKGPKKHKAQVTAGEDRIKFLAPRAFA